MVRAALADAPRSNSARHTAIVPAVGVAPASQSWKGFSSLQLEVCQFQLATTQQTSLGTDDGAQLRSPPAASCANCRCGLPKHRPGIRILRRSRSTAAAARRSVWGSAAMQARACRGGRRPARSASGKQMATRSQHFTQHTQVSSFCMLPGDSQSLACASARAHTPRTEIPRTVNRSG